MPKRRHMSEPYGIDSRMASRTFLPQGAFERSNASSLRPKLEAMQVGVEEPGWVLKFEARHPVEPDVGEPHQSRRYGQRTPRQKAEAHKESVQDAGVEEVV